MSAIFFENLGEIGNRKRLFQKRHIYPDSLSFIGYGGNR